MTERLSWMTISTMTDTPQNPPQDMPAFKGLEAPFLRRTVAATLITLALVALNAWVYFDRDWAYRYFFAGIWTLAFLGLTPLILKEILFTRRLLNALGLIGAKLILLGIMLGACIVWSNARPGALNFGSSLIAGVSTPLIVVLLRAIGSQMKSTPVGRVNG